MFIKQLFLLCTTIFLFVHSLSADFDAENSKNSTLPSHVSLEDDIDNNVQVKVSPLDTEEAEESARLEEEEMEEEIRKAESELQEIVEEQRRVQEEQEIPKNVDLRPEEHAAMIKAKAVQNLMQIFGLPGSLVRDDTAESSKSAPAPEFMIDLYHTITDASGVTRAKNPYNAHVVRSFIERDSSQNDFFFFNVSGLEKTESILEAELHLHRLPTPHSALHPSLFLTPFQIISLYQVVDPNRLDIPDLHKLLGVRYVPALGSGWEVFNVKKSVMEWLNGDSENHGLLVAATSLGGEKVPLRFSRRAETANSKQPILVLFNHDSHMAVTGPKIQSDVKTVRKVKVNEDGTETSYETTTPLSSLENPQYHHSLLFQDSIRHPNSVSRFRSRRSRSNDSSIDPFEHANSTHNHTSPRNLTSCEIHDLFVSFEAIGWSSWIISPKGYNAHYCEGPCVFPLGKSVAPTNHATVQSIINELNLTPGLTRPCCVPTTLLPISLLYYDDQDNVVLKQYVDMVAETCGCH